MLRLPTQTIDVVDIDGNGESGESLAVLRVSQQ